MIFSKHELSEIFNQKINRNIDDICVNSNDIKSGDLFIALKGEKTDGHRFIGKAIDGGAALVISEEDVDEVKKICNDESIESDMIIKVESSHEALLKLARYNVSQTHAKYIGITGSVGKTTTKNLIHHLLSKVWDDVYAARKNFNSQIGLPICAAAMPRNSKIGIFEMGMNNPGEIRKLLDIIQPSISIISQICETHLEFFNSVLDIAKAKSEIFETNIPQDAVIIPADSAYTDFLKQRAIEHGVRARNIFTFGSENLDANAKVLKCDYVDDHISVEAEILGANVKYILRSSNNSLINNSLSSILCAHIISAISLQELADKVSDFDAPCGRGVDFHLENKDIILIDDAYNACPTSVKSAIKSLSNYNKAKGRRKILILGDMLELGKDADHYHENLSAAIDKYGIDVVFACGNLSKKLFENLRECKKGIWSENSSELAEKCLPEIRDGDCILVKGSHSMNMDHIVSAIKNDAVKK